MIARLGLPIVLALLAVVISGCAQQPQIVAPAPSGQAAQALFHWHVKGKVGITTQQERVSANLDWQQMADAYRISLSGPFGQGRADLDGDDTSITLTTGNQTYRGANAEQLMQQQLGWSVPVRHFAYWAKGIPSPLAPITAVEYDAEGALSTLVQDGWQVNLSRYSIVDGWQLPGRVSAKTEQIALLMVAKEWHLP